MPQASRVSDTESGTCCPPACRFCPHGRTGTVTTGSNDVFTNGLKAAFVSSRGTIACPHGGSLLVTGGSSTVFINGKRATRINDSTICSSCGCGGSMNKGSSNVFIGG